MNKILKFPEKRNNALPKRAQKPITVRIVDDTNNVLWERGTEEGVACRSYIEDGTQRIIIEVLAEALEQAKGQLSCLNHTD